ncbi:hypothetical protein HK097_006820 [Rhizophlyctis rosea]|uniref:Uncharacterized protein n=1 Tax=Rhizophlyctis rosea TaxID=64517 RepID=A0AAD5SDW3_9FUNG|nr:hypothetical protein HK097_006820 [Rhizophlyctis rosea]
MGLPRTPYEIAKVFSYAFLSIILVLSIAVTSILALHSRYGPSHQCLFFIDIDYNDKRDRAWITNNSSTCMAAIGISAYSTVLSLAFILQQIVYLYRPAHKRLIHLGIVISLLSAFILVSSLITAKVGVDQTCEALIGYGKQNAGVELPCEAYWQGGWSFNGVMYHPSLTILEGGINVGFVVVGVWVGYAVTGFWLNKRKEVV